MAVGRLDAQSDKGRKQTDCVIFVFLLGGLQIMLYLCNSNLSTSSIKVKGFSRSNEDELTEKQENTNGVGFFFTKDFSKFFPVCLYAFFT